MTSEVMHTVPLVSISVITYNHEKYVVQTIEGILAQQVSFPIEIIIGDDCSTDNTRPILQEYQRKHPHIIKLLLHKTKGEGIPGKVNFISTIEAANGKYIALLDGDDYWTDPTKLQRQIDFLEQNEDYSICFHKAAIVYEGPVERVYPDINQSTPETTTLADLIEGNYIHASTCVFRKSFSAYPDWFMGVFTGDWVTHILNAQHGKIYFINREMAVYRIHNRGLISATKSLLNDLNKMEMYGALAEHFRYDNSPAYVWFNGLHHHEKAFFYGIQNVGNNSVWRRMKILISSGWITKKPKLWLAAVLVPLTPGDLLARLWKSASEAKLRIR